MLTVHFIIRSVTGKHRARMFLFYVWPFLNIIMFLSNILHLKLHSYTNNIAFQFFFPNYYWQNTTDMQKQKPWNIHTMHTYKKAHVIKKLWQKIETTIYKKIYLDLVTYRDPWHLRTETRKSSLRVHIKHMIGRLKTKLIILSTAFPGTQYGNNAIIIFDLQICIYVP